MRTHETNGPNWSPLNISNTPGEPKTEGVGGELSGKSFSKYFYTYFHKACQKKQQTFKAVSAAQTKLLTDT